MTTKHEEHEAKLAAKNHEEHAVKKHEHAALAENDSAAMTHQPKAILTRRPKRLDLRTNDLVRYFETQDSLGVNALVLGSRQISDHSGENGEPLLTLAFAQDQTHPISKQVQPLHGTGQQAELVQIRQEVAHISHAYSEEQARKYAKPIYEGGRWRLLSEAEALEAVS